MRVWARPWSGYATAPSRAARMELVRGDVRQACSGVLTACGPLLTFVARCVQMSSSVAGDLGYVLRPTLAGHRIRPASVAPSTPCSRGQVEDTANGACARTPNRQPRHPGGMARRGMPPEVETGRRWCPRAQDRFAVSSTHPGRHGVDAAARCSLRRCPASVGRRTGAPPSPWRGSRDTLTARPQAASGRKQPLPPHWNFMRRGSREARWGH